MPVRSATGARNGSACSPSSRRSRATGGRAGWSRPRAVRPIVADRIAELAKDESVVARFIDYRQAGPGTLPEVFGKAEVIVCTEDFEHDDLGGRLGATPRRRRRA